MAGTITTDLAFFSGATTTSACESATGWSGITVATDSDANIEGTYCLGAKIATGLTAPAVYTLGTATDITGKNMYGWVSGQKIGQWNTQANGGIRLRVDDGTRYAEWFVAGSDTLPHQGWICHSVNFCDLLSAGIAEYPLNTFANQTTAANNATATDMNLMRPTGTPAINDAYYFGHTEPFRELLVNVGTNGAGTWTYTWEYYSGAAWSTLTVTDNTTNYTAGVGIRTIKFTPPSDWYPTTVNSQGPYYYIRSRITAYTSLTTRPLGTRAWVRFGATPNRAGLITGDTNDGIECNYSAITKIGLRFNLSAGLNRTNVWWDAFRYGTKLSIDQGTSGSPGTFADFLTAEKASSYGVITNSEGVLNTQGILEFGDSAGTDATYFKDTNRHIRFRDNFLGNIANGIQIVGNATGNTEVYFGTLTQSGSNNLVSGGLLVDANSVTPNFTKWTFRATNATNTFIYFYGNTFRNAQRMYFGDNLTAMDNVNLVGNYFESNGIIYFNILSADTTSLNEQNVITASTSNYATHIYDLGQWKQQQVTSNTYGIVLKSSSVTFNLNTTTFVNNTTDIYFYQPSGTTTLNAIDSTDNLISSQYSTNNWNLYEKTTYNLNIKDTSGNNINQASAQLMDTNSVEQFVGLTNASGNITEQQILRRTRIYAGSSVATTTHNPYRLRMRKYLYDPVEISGKTYSITALSDSFILSADTYSTDDYATVSGWTGLTINETVALSAAIADDGGAMTNETPAANNGTTDDMTLLPATPAANDAYYFGGPFKFSSLKINFFTAGAGTWSITWEYYNGSTWASLAGISDGTSGFKHTSIGTKIVSWTLNANWTASTINSQGPFYYVRARVSSYTSITTQPKGTQSWLQNRMELSTTTRTMKQVYEWMRYYTAITSPSHMSLSDPLTTADGTTFANSQYAYLVDGTSMSGATSILNMATQDFYTANSGSQTIKKLTDIDGTAVLIEIKGVTASTTQCYIADGNGVALLNEEADGSGAAQAAFTHTIDTAIIAKARNKGYLPFETTGTITSDGYSVNAVWQADPNWKLVVSGVSITFNNANPDTIVRAAGSFTADGWEIPGYVAIEGSSSNDGKYLVDTIVGATITLDAGENLTGGTDASGVTLTFTRS